MTKPEIVSILNDIGTLLELTGENFFKSRAYYNAARILEGQTEDVEDLIRSGKLGELPGFGEAITEKITTLVNTGRLPYYEDLKKKIPAGLLTMIQIPGLGPKKAKALYDRLQIDSVKKLEDACRKNKIAGLEGFGEKSQAKILESLGRVKKYKERHRIDEALPVAQSIFERLKKHPDVVRCDIGGSLRRQRETIGDIDFLASSERPQEVIDFFLKLPEVKSIQAHGDTKASALLKDGLQADLRVVSDKEYPFALHYFTGNKEHNTKIRQRAKDMGFKLNEYGLFKGEKSVSCKTEEDLFQTLKLSYIPPELREDIGEIEAAEKNKIPELIKESDIRGVFHVHSTWSDGTAPLESMIAEVQRLGLDYVGISDHSQTATYAHGMEPKRVLEQEKEIERLRKKFKIRIFWGIESDILPDGSLDYPEKILERFDFVIASIHSSFKMPEGKMTKRIVKALQNKYTTFLGHMTGRLILSREPYALDMKKVIQAAADFGKVIEINSHPVRLDIDWRWQRYAKDKGVQFSINPDAHAIEGLADYRYGVGIARKGWLTKGDIVTTFSVSQMEKWISA